VHKNVKYGSEHKNDTATTAILATIINNNN